ncbi:MAG TPA: GNAT family N-acetyltransferase [Acidimicrobiales bacterium]
MTEPPQLTIHPVSGIDVEDVHAELVTLYRRCYAGPPWHEGDDEVAAYATRIRSWATRDSFTGLIARVPDRDGLAGATYGWLDPPEIRGLPMPGVDRPRVFHVGDLMVDPDHRRRGLGRRLLDQLVAGRLPAALVTHRDSGSRRLYESAGWRHTGTLTPPGSWTMLVYVREPTG